MLQRAFKLNPVSLIVATVAASVTVPSALAQEIPSRSRSVLLEEVVVTARKRDESMQDVPVAVTAYGADHIDTLKVRDLTNLSVGMPNVSLDDVGSVKGTANFTIRGLGIYSSIPTIDPTVGIFIDGVYLGTTFGVIMDTFDLEKIEVLRGPQGTLFGRNVTGGAVLLDHKKPGDNLEFAARVAVDGNPNGDGGLNSYANLSVGGPLTDTLGAKISGYYNKDDGWFVNEFNGENGGGNEQKLLRPSLIWTPSDTLEVLLSYEYAEINADGPATQSHTNGQGIPGTPVNFSRYSFKYSNDEKGFLDSTKDFFTSQINWDVDFGDGVITNIFGWRAYDGQGLTDIDSQPVPVFHLSTDIDAEQYSEELRYTGRFYDSVNVTTGLYYFTNDLKYGEERYLLGVLTPDNSPAQTQSGGGIQKTDSYAWFGAIDYDLTESLVVNAGLNYTREKKEVEIASLPLNVNSPCSVVNGTCPIDFRDEDTWSNWSSKLGLTYFLSAEEIIYGSWSVGYRSGGYNVRNTALDTVNFGPGPFDEEEVSNFEVGYKGTLLDGKARFNAAVFFTEVADMQREIILADPNAGLVQLIRNSADAEIWGVEFDATFSLLSNLVAIASVGYTDASYSEVKFDLNGDGVIDGKDKNLKLPRVPEWTYSLALNLDTDLGEHGYMVSRLSYAYRDESRVPDNNFGRLNSLEMVEAGIDFHTADERWTVSLYGRNLLNEVSHGGDTPLPANLGPVPLGGTLAPMSKGRTVGLEISYSM